jgi:hypothetical protein
MRISNEGADEVLTEPPNMIGRRGLLSPANA